MKAALLVAAACSSPAPPAIHNETATPVARDALWCGSIDASYSCFAKQADCTADHPDCVAITAPRWTCARELRKYDRSVHLELCYPTPEICNKDYVIAEDDREACMPAASVYCREAEGLVICHPTLAVCQREAKELADRLGTPLTCTQR